jgi:hypothetical protein
MSGIVRDAIAAELATLTRIMPAPTGALGYGSDLACADDLTETMAERAGTDPLVIGEALLRRLDCPRGGLPDDKDYGLDVRAYLSRGTGATELRELAGQVRAESMKDDRVSSCTVTVSPSSDGSSMGISIRVTPADPTLAPFTLVFSVTSIEVLLLELRR